MDNLTQITDHAEAGFNRLLNQFRDGGNFGEMVQAFSGRFQGLEDALFSLIAGRYLANATGETLSQIGDLVGEPRPIYGPAVDSDSDYRVLIYGRIAANTSQGRLEDLVRILGALNCTAIKIYQVYPASITVNFIGNELLNGTERVRDILTLAKAQVSMDITNQTESAFGFLGDLTAYGFGSGEIGEGI